MSKEGLIFPGRASRAFIGCCRSKDDDIKVVMALGFHLFPFRTEKLSPITPMVLRNSGRVGSRRFSKCEEHEVEPG